MKNKFDLMIFSSHLLFGFCLRPLVDGSDWLILSFSRFSLFCFLYDGLYIPWFMLVMVLRRLVMLGVAAVSRGRKPFLLGTRVPEDNKLRGRQVDTPAVVPDRIEFTKDVRVNKTIGNNSENDPYW
jgi:hypothetical protein